MSPTVIGDATIHVCRACRGSGIDPRTKAAHRADDWPLCPRCDGSGEGAPEPVQLVPAQWDCVSCAAPVAADGKTSLPASNYWRGTPLTVETAYCSAQCSLAYHEAISYRHVALHRGPALHRCPQFEYLPGSDEGVE